MINEPKEAHHNRVQPPSVIKWVSHSLTSNSALLKCGHRSIQLDDVFEALMEHVLHDFGEHVSDGLLDLLVDPLLNVGLGVSNIFDGLAFVLKDAAVARVVQVEIVLWADTMALASIDMVVTFLWGPLTFTFSVVDEDFGLTNTVLLDIELWDGEVSNGLEFFILIFSAATLWVLALVSISGSGLVA